MNIYHNTGNQAPTLLGRLLMTSSGESLQKLRNSLLILMAAFFTVVSVEANIIPGNSPNWASLVSGGARGDSANPFHGEQPIARWTTVSFQSYSKPFPVGLVAFHGCGQALGNEGIEKVEFIANDGQVATVLEPSPNPETGRWEWWALMDPLLSDGVVEVRAIIYPYSGVSRILQGAFSGKLEAGQNVPDNQQSVVLWSNKSGTYTKPDMWVSVTGSDDTGDGTQAKPFRTIHSAVYKGYEANADFGRVLLTKGTYPMHNTSWDAYLNSKGWFTIEAAPGEKREDVIIGGNTDQGASTRYRTICFRNLTFDYKIPSTPSLSSPSTFQQNNVWLDGVSVSGVDATTSFGSYFSGVRLAAVTGNSRYRVVWKNFKGGPTAPIVVGVDVSNCSGDVFTGVPLVRDWTVSNTVMLPADHPDLWQSFGSNPNRILMDGKIVGGNIQLIFLDATLYNNTDLAMVNVVLAANGGGVGQIGASLKHVLFWNIELVGQDLSIPQLVGKAPTFGMFGSVLSKVGYALDQKPETYQWTLNQFARAPVTGTASAVVDPNYTTSFVAANVMEIPKRTVRWDLEQKPRQVPYRCGAYANPALIKTIDPVKNLRVVH